MPSFFPSCSALTQLYLSLLFVLVSAPSSVKYVPSYKDLALRFPWLRLFIGLIPGKLLILTISFTPTSKADLRLHQKQLALESIANMSSSVPTACHLYADGSL